MIHVLYESSVLYAAQTDKCAKTGIYRVVDELLKQLLTYNNIDVHPFIVDFKDADALLMDDDFGELLAKEYGINEDQYVKNDKVWNKENFLTRNIYGPLYEAREKVRTRSNSNSLHLIYRKALSFWIKNIRKSLGSNFVLDVNQYDLCHFLTYKVNKNFRHMKSLYTIHDLIPLKFPELLSSDNERKIYIESMNNVNENTWLTCVSESTRNDLLYYFPHIKPERVFVTYNSVSNNIYKVTNEDVLSKVLAKFGLDNDTNYLISVSTIEPRKNMISVLKAFKELLNNRNYNDLKLVLVGPHGWRFDDILNEISIDERLEERVIFTGFVSDDELSALYTKARIFLYVSLYEGFGIPPLEAMKCGTPVITSNCSSLPEVIGDSGIMVDPMDVEEIIHSIQLILENSAFSQDLTVKGEKRVKNFSWEKLGLEVNSIYNKIHNS